MKSEYVLPGSKFLFEFIFFIQSPRCWCSPQRIAEEERTEGIWVRLFFSSFSSSTLSALTSFGDLILIDGRAGDGCRLGKLFEKLSRLLRLRIDVGELCVDEGLVKRSRVVDSNFVIVHNTLVWTKMADRSS